MSTVISVARCSALVLFKGLQIVLFIHKMHCWHLWQKSRTHDASNGAGHQLHSLEATRRTMYRFPPHRYHSRWGHRTVLRTVEGALFHRLYALWSLDAANRNRYQSRSLHSSNAARGIVYRLPLPQSSCSRSQSKFVRTAQILAIYPLHCHSTTGGTSHTFQVCSIAKSESESMKYEINFCYSFRNLYLLFSLGRSPEMLVFIIHGCKKNFTFVTL